VEGDENHEPPRFCIEVNVSMVLTYSDVEPTVDLHCKILCFNRFFCDMIIFSIVLSKKYN
jgi:hypothetical protein